MLRATTLLAEDLSSPLSTISGSSQTPIASDAEDGCSFLTSVEACTSIHIPTHIGTHVLGHTNINKEKSTQIPGAFFFVYHLELVCVPLTKKHVLHTPLSSLCFRILVFLF